MKVTITVLGGSSSKQSSVEKIMKVFKDNNSNVTLDYKEPYELYDGLQTKGNLVDKVLLINLMKDQRLYKDSYGSMDEMIQGLSSLLGKKNQLIICDRNECMKDDFDAVCIGCNNVTYHNFESLTPTAIYTYVFGNGSRSSNKNVSKQYKQAVEAKTSQILDNYRIEEAPVADDEPEEAPTSKGKFFSGLKNLFSGRKKSVPVEVEEAPEVIEEAREDNYEDSDFEEAEECEDMPELLPSVDDSGEDEEEVSPLPPLREEEVLPPIDEAPELFGTEKVSVDDLFSGPESNIDTTVTNFEDLFSKDDEKTPTVDEIIEEYSEPIVESPYAKPTNVNAEPSSPINATNNTVSNLGEDFDSLNNVDSDIQADMYQYKLDRQTEVLEAQNTASDLVSDAQNLMNAVKGHNKHLSNFVSKGNNGNAQKETLRQLRRTAKIMTPDEQILRQHRIVLVTGEHNSGVSSIVASVGYCAASMGKKVLIVDMDLINRTQSQLYENANSNATSYSGLVPALNRWNDLTYYTYKTIVPGLSTLGVDITDSDNFNHIKSLNYSNFISLLTNASHDYHLVIVDLPFETLIPNQNWVSIAQDVFYVLENDTYGVVNMLNKLCLDNFGYDRNSFFNTINKLSFIFSKFNDASEFNDKPLNSDTVAEVIEYYLGDDAEDYTSRKWIAEIPYYKELCNQIAKHTPACILNEEYKEICRDIIRNWG